MHDGHAGVNPSPHERHADKDSYPHNKNVTDYLCSFINFVLNLL